ncbi:MAG TPA: pilus assembly protein TadG-related protein, partial [Polyangiaceae bacterium]|nr:pilus assembly protein TadG-related protein [Polyangiaceae bacterium]
MNRIPKPSTESPALVRDQRGAVMVFGLLACVLLVGLLWTVIGVGEMTSFRERAQDAADSAAYSTAVMVSRGMNTLVLFNVLMSLVLAVRVALKVLQFALLIAGGVLLLAGLFTAGATVGPAMSLFAAAGTVQSMLGTVNPVIAAGLEGLQLAAGGVQAAMPAFAQGAGTYAGKQYAPLVKDVFVASPYAEEPELLVNPPALREDQFAGVPCKHAGEAAVDVMFFVVGKIIPAEFISPIRGALKDAIGGLVGNPVTALYFCELGVNIHPPDTPALDDAVERVKKECLKKLGLPEDRDKFEDELTIAQRTELQSCVEATTNAVDGAKDLAASEASKALNGKFGAPPTLNLDRWSNGDPGSQIVAVVTLQTESALRAGKGVSIAAWGNSHVSGTPPTQADKAFAQAETYYDCAGHWEADCHGMDEAMWNFAWRARLVSVDPEGSFIKNEVAKANEGLKSALRATRSNAQPVQ